MFAPVDRQSANASQQGADPSALVGQGAGLRSLFQLTNSAAVLWSLFCLQAFCAVYFLGEGILEGLGVNPDLFGIDHEIFESVLAVALIASVAFTFLEIRNLLARQQRMEAQIKAASGAFAKLLDEHFEQWALTPSERDVALLAIKGLSIAEIARVRETKDGTIKAQCNAIYRKAGVTGRAQLLSFFIEELMADDLLQAGQSRNA